MPGRVAGVAAEPGRAVDPAGRLAEELELDAAGLDEEVFTPAKAVPAIRISMAADVAAATVPIPVRLILLVRMTDSSNVVVAAEDCLVLDAWGRASTAWTATLRTPWPRIPLPSYL